MTQVRFRAPNRVPAVAGSSPIAHRGPTPAPAWLLPLSIVYLALPTFVFVSTWTRPSIALPTGAACLGVVAFVVREGRTAPAVPVPRPTMATIWVTATAAGTLTGAGGVAPQTWDWLKHNALLRDLVSESWPVVYETNDGGGFGLTYYVGYHLPAAAVGKVAGWQAANAALLVWTILGLVLALTWFVVLVGPRIQRWMVVGFIAFSGLDIVGRMVLGPVLAMPDPSLPSNQLDWWAVIGKYPNHLTSVMWAPHHALGGWIGAGLVLSTARQRSLHWLVPTIAFCGLISPFVALGLVPLALYAIGVRGPEHVGARIKTMLSPLSVAAAVAALPVLVYYAAKSAPLPAPYNGSITSGFALTDPIRPLDPGRALLAYLLLIVLEVLVFVLIIRRSPTIRQPRTRLLLGVVATTLVVLPLYRYGTWSDLAMRAVVPSMFALAVLVAQSFLAMPRGSTTRRVLLVVLAVGMVAPLGEATRALTDRHANGDVVETHADHSDIDTTSGIMDLSGSVYLDVPRFVAQHTAPTSSFFFTRMAAAPSASE